MVSPEVLGIPVKMEPQATDGKAAMLKAFQDLTAVVDSAGICVFTTFAWGLAEIQPQIQAACEGDWSEERLLLMGERIWNLERQFNIAAGITGKDDRLPPRLMTEPAQTGPQKGAVSKLDVMLPEYYEARGWTTDGVPTPETRRRLGV
jgi:aldehyde:ferredoxin oxidoreductase